MTQLVVAAILAGQLVHAQHEFADRSACLRVGAMVWNQLKAEAAENITVRCYQEPAT